MHGVMVTGFNFLSEEVSFIILCLKHSCKYKQNRSDSILFLCESFFP